MINTAEIKQFVREQSERLGVAVSLTVKFRSWDDVVFFAYPHEREADYFDTLEEAMNFIREQK